jgi:hypothetical protein
LYRANKGRPSGHSPKATGPVLSKTAGGPDPGKPRPLRFFGGWALRQCSVRSPPFRALGPFSHWRSGLTKGTKMASDPAINQSVLLLGKYQFTGDGHTAISAAGATTMNNLATTLDNCNNDRP